MLIATLFKQLFKLTIIFHNTLVFIIHVWTKQRFDLLFRRRMDELSLCLDKYQIGSIIIAR